MIKPNIKKTAIYQIYRIIGNVIYLTSAASSGTITHNITIKSSKSIQLKELRKQRKEKLNKLNEL